MKSDADSAWVAFKSSAFLLILHSLSFSHTRTRPKVILQKYSVCVCEYLKILKIIYDIYDKYGVYTSDAFYAS